LVLCLSIAATLPLILPQMPPLLDLPGHIGRYAVQLDGGQSPDLARWYSYRWDLVPNLGVDLLVALLGQWFGLFTAVKVAVLAIPFLFVAGIAMMSRSLHGYVTPPAIFAMPLAFGHFFHFGFVNFYLGISLGLIAFAGWRRLADAGCAGPRLWLFPVIACALWTVHLTGWALLCVLCGCDELARIDWRGRRRLAAVAGAGGRLLVLLAPLPLKIWFGAPSGVDTSARHFFDIVDKLGSFTFVFRDRWPVWDIGSALLLVGLYIYAVRSRTFTLDRAMVGATACIAALFVLLPTELLGSWYADARLTPVLYSVALLSLRPAAAMSSRAMTALATAALLFTGARLTGNAISLGEWDAQFRKDAAAFDLLPRGSSMVTLVATPCGSDMPWNRDRRTHLSGLVIPLRHGFDNGQWAIPGGQLIRVANPDSGIFQTAPSGEWRDRDCSPGMAWYHHVAAIPAQVPYLWIVGTDVKAAIPGWTKIRDTGTAQLYRR
jgi:hypothetical protein